MSVSFFYSAGADVPADRTEVARYLGYTRASPPDSSIAALIGSVCTEMRELIKPQAVYDAYTLFRSTDNALSFAGITLHSADLCRNLDRCSSVVLLAATIGLQPDIFIRRAQQQNSVQAAVAQAAGAMFIESFVNMLNGKISSSAAKNGRKTHPRYSPGYGDVPLLVQHDFFRLLPCTRIGLTLMDTLVMAPEKSVTAFIGIE